MYLVRIVFTRHSCELINNILISVLLIADNTEDHNKQILGLEKQLSEALRSRAVVVEEFEHFKSAAEVYENLLFFSSIY